MRIKKKNPLRSKKNDFFFIAKQCVKQEQYVLARIWLERAEKLYPITMMQAWSIKNIVGGPVYREIAPKRLLEFEFADNY